MVLKRNVKFLAQTVGDTTYIYCLRCHVWIPESKFDSTKTPNHKTCDKNFKTVGVRDKISKEITGKFNRIANELLK